MRSTFGGANEAHGRSRGYTSAAKLAEMIQGILYIATEGSVKGVNAVNAPCPEG